MVLEIPPPAVRWEHSVSELIDRLVESDINCIVVQEAIERLIHYGLSDRIAVPIGDVEGEMVYWHPMPPLFPGMRPMHIFWTADEDGGFTVVHAEVA